MKSQIHMAVNISVIIFMDCGMKVSQADKKWNMINKIMNKMNVRGGNCLSLHFKIMLFPNCSC